MDVVAAQGVLPSARHSTAGIQLQWAPRPVAVDLHVPYLQINQEKIDGDFIFCFQMPWHGICFLH